VAPGDGHVMEAFRRGRRVATRIVHVALRPVRRAARVASLVLERTWQAGLAGRRAAGDPAAMQEVIDSLPNVVPVNFAFMRGLGDPRLNVMIPGMAMWAMSGGPNTALNLTYRLAEAGVPVRYISTDIPPDADHDPLWEHLQTVSGVQKRLDNVDIVNGRSAVAATKIARDDIFFGTAWWTVQMIKHALPEMRLKRFFYLIQDFEPGFYPWSTVHALALETYDLDYTPIVNEALLLDHLVEHRIGRFAEPRFAAAGMSFDPAVDSELFHADDRPATDERTLLFYARPDAPRNLFELGLVALKRAADRGAFSSGRWNLHSMGERDLRPARLSKDVVITPVEWLTYREYARLLRGSDVGLALMLSPHTGYPAIEMAACGMCAITNTYSVKTGDRLRAISPNIDAVPPVAEELVAAIERAVAAAEADGTRKGGCSLPSSWDDVFDGLVPRLVEAIALAQRGGGADGG